MATFTKQNTFAPGTPAESAEVNVNFDDIFAALNNSLVHLDGSKTMTGFLVTPNAFPTTARQVANKQYVDARETAINSRSDGRFVRGDTQLGGATAVGTHNNEPFIVKAGVQQGTVDAFGDIVLNWGTAFPTGVMSVNATLELNGGSINVLNSKVAVWTITTSGCKFRLTNGAGTSYTSGDAKVQWVAVGF